MSKHLPLILTLLISAGFIASHFWLTSPPPELSFESKAQNETTIATPDFQGIGSVRDRKKTFFKFIGHFVKQRNEEIKALRQQIENREFEGEDLLKLAKRYRIKSQDPDTIYERLLIKVDIIPESLVLAQAAIESAWGTSRFAVEGNNYFGQWCFREGCGLVPDGRQEGKKHEVRVFKSPMHSVVSYMNNLNSHPAYKSLRATRTEKRRLAKNYHGCALAEGLTSYSEKGNHYVETLKLLIRANKLEPDPHKHCAAAMVAEEVKAETPDTAFPATEIATDDVQSQSSPLPSPDNIPSS